MHIDATLLALATTTMFEEEPHPLSISDIEFEMNTTRISYLYNQNTPQSLYARRKESVSTHQIRCRSSERNE